MWRHRLVLRCRPGEREAKSEDMTLRPSPRLTPDLVVKNLTKGTTIPAKQDLSEREKAMLKAGGLLAYTRQDTSACPGSGRAVEGW